jgi:hypothetical protein
MPVELPATVVYAYPGPQTTYSTDDGWDDQFDSMPAYVREIMAIPLAAEPNTLNGAAVWAAAATNNAASTTEEVCKGLSGQNAFTVRSQLAMHVYASYLLGAPIATGQTQQYYADDAVASSLYMLYGQFITSNANQMVGFDEHSVDFYGTPFMPIAGIGYWLFGNGLTRKVYVKSLNLQMVATDFAPITAVLNDPAVGAGVYQISDHFEYNTFSRAPLDLAAAGLIGRANGTVTGTLQVLADGTYTFDGAYTLNDDVYDAPTSNRTWGQEALTTFLRGLGETFGHADYQIKFLGQQEIHFEGRRN